MPYTEFIMWKAYLDEELNTPTKTEYYLAQIAAEIRRTISKNRNSVKLEDFLNPVKFVRKKIKITGSKRRKHEHDEINRVKSLWFAITGYKRGKKNV